MINDAQFFKQDTQILSLFKEDVLANESQLLSSDRKKLSIDLNAEDERRIERIVEKAKFTIVVKHSISFLFKTIGVGASGLVSVAIEAVRSARDNVDSCTDTTGPNTAP